MCVSQVTGTLLKGYKARFKGAPISSTVDYLKQYVSVSLAVGADGAANGTAVGLHPKGLARSCRDCISMQASSASTVLTVSEHFCFAALAPTTALLFLRYFC